MNHVRPALAAGALVLLAACASSPVDVPDGVELQQINPADAGVGSDGTVMWGGVIVGTSVLANGTRLDLLAYPLDRIGRPLRGRDSTGRFVAEASEYLEPIDYAPGREITVLGTLGGRTALRIGESDEDLPTVAISDLHLWQPGNTDNRPRLTFGIGINISN